MQHNSLSTSSMPLSIINVKMTIVCTSAFVRPNALHLANLPMDACIHTHIQIHMHTTIHTHNGVQSFIRMIHCTCKQKGIHTCTHIQYLYVHTFIYTYILTYLLTYSHTYAHTIHTYIHTY